MMMKYKYLYFLSFSHIAQMKPTFQMLIIILLPLIETDSVTTASTGFVRAPK